MNRSHKIWLSFLEGWEAGEVEAGNGGTRPPCLSSSVSTTHSFPFLFSFKILSMFEEKEFALLCSASSRQCSVCLILCSYRIFRFTIFWIIVASSVVCVVIISFPNWSLNPFLPELFACWVNWDFRGWCARFPLNFLMHIRIHECFDSFCGSDFW